MNIQYYGDYCFKITTKPAGRATDDVIVWIDPPERGSGLRGPQGEADVIFLSHGENEEARQGFKGNPVIIDAPGEYAARGITALGYPTFQDEASGASLGQNTVFSIESEDLHLCFLGALGHELSPETLDRVNGVDILFVPVGEDGTLSSKQAAELARKIEPRIIIPMHYKIPGLVGKALSEKGFCEAIGSCPEGAVPRLSIKKKDLEGKALEVVILERGS